MQQWQEGRTLGKGLNATGPRQEHPKGPTEGSLWLKHPLLVVLSISIVELIYDRVFRLQATFMPNNVFAPCITNGLSRFSAMVLLKGYEATDTAVYHQGKSLGLTCTMEVIHHSNTPKG